MPKDNWIKHHEPFKEICKENEIVNDDCNMHDPIPENEVLYKHVNFFGVDRPCERPMIEDATCMIQFLKMKLLMMIATCMIQFLKMKLLMMIATCMIQFLKMKYCK